MSKRAAADRSTKKHEKALTYDRDIICLPESCKGKSGDIKIPRGREIREFLARNRLIGKIRLYSSMTEDDILDEICSVFAGPMNGDLDFPFTILQPTGGCSKSLAIPSVSSSYKWTASAVAGKNSKMPIYILAEGSLKVSCVGTYRVLPNLCLNCSHYNNALFTAAGRNQQ